MKGKMIDIERQFLINGVYSAFSFAWDDRFIFHGESHDFWEIVFITAGGVEVVEDGKVYTLGKNNMILHAPLEFHRIRSKSGEQPEGFILTFRVAGELPRELRHGIFILTEADKSHYLDICQKASLFLKEREQLPYIGQEVADLLSAFLVRLGSSTANRSVADSPSASEYRKVVAAMTEGICQNLTLADFAASCNVCISYLKLLFKKYAGISPKSYFTNLRVQHAAKLLEAHTITEVADLMSFSSPNYFSTFFKKHTGTLPSEYKRT